MPLFSHSECYCSLPYEQCCGLRSAWSKPWKDPWIEEAEKRAANKHTEEFDDLFKEFLEWKANKERNEQKLP